MALNDVRFIGMKELLYEEKGRERTWFERMKEKRSRG
jgi:hypothetical protein